MFDEVNSRIQDIVSLSSLLSVLQQAHHLAHHLAYHHCSIFSE